MRTRLKNPNNFVLLHVKPFMLFCVQLLENRRTRRLFILSFSFSHVVRDFHSVWYKERGREIVSTAWNIFKAGRTNRCTIALILSLHDERYFFNTLYTHSYTLIYTQTHFTYSLNCNYNVNVLIHFVR